MVYFWLPMNTPCIFLKELFYSDKIHMTTQFTYLKYTTQWILKSFETIAILC